MKKGKKVLIIGAGFGGLSAAIRLANAGFEVEVYDRQAHVGGKAGSLTEGGYRFDTGPSLITMREVFSQLFEETGRRLDDYLELIPLSRPGATRRHSPWRWMCGRACSAGGSSTRSAA